MNSEHYEIVTQGVQSLNKWREIVLNQHVQLDLSDCDLAGFDLAGAKLGNALLTNSNLKDTKLLSLIHISEPTRPY